MAVRVAYGEKENIQSAIQSGTVPTDSIIITKDSTEPEMMFYDKDRQLVSIAERTKFLTMTEAEIWAKKYDCAGQIFTIHNGSEWLPYIVQGDGTLSPFKADVGDVSDIKVIDGGTSFGNE